MKGLATRYLPLELKCDAIKEQGVIRVIRENPASRGTETSAEVLVGPPLGAGGDGTSI
jgi:hypothetical protein